MNKKMLDEIRAIICEEYINKKEQILKDEISGKIDSKRALEQRMKLIGMMTAVEIIQREYMKAEDDYKCFECGKISSAEDIDNSTKNYFGGDIESITSINKVGSDFICPKCKEIVEGSCFRKVD